MRRHPVCRYYAKALIQSVSGLDEAIMFLEQLEICRKLFEENREVYSAFISSWVSFKKKNNMLDELSLNMELDGRVSRFIRIVIKNKRIDLFSGIVDVYIEMLDDMRNIKKVLVVSPRSILDEDMEYLREKLSEISGMEIKVRNSVDPVILGGIKLMFDGKVYDHSVSTKLNAIRKSFLEA